MSAYRAAYPVATMCRVLEVSSSGYYAWVKPPPSDYAVRDRVLKEMVRRIHTNSHETCGASPIHADLCEAGINASRKRVARLMREAGSRGVSRRKGFTTTRRSRNRCLLLIWSIGILPRQGRTSLGCRRPQSSPTPQSPRIPKAGGLSTIPTCRPLSGPQ